MNYYPRSPHRPLLTIVTVDSSAASAMRRAHLTARCDGSTFPLNADAAVTDQLLRDHEHRICALTMLVAEAHRYNSAAVNLSRVRALHGVIHHYARIALHASHDNRYGDAEAAWLHVSTVIAQEHLFRRNDETSIQV